MERYEEIVKYFQEYPENALDNIKIEPWETVRNGKEFIESHIEVLKYANPLWRYQVYYDRLVKYWQICRALNEF